MRAGAIFVVAAVLGGAAGCSSKDKASKSSPSDEEAAKKEALKNTKALPAKPGTTEPLAAKGVRTWTFDDETGPLPKGWRTAETDGDGTPATWSLEKRDDAPSPPTVFGVTETDNPKPTFNVAIAPDSISMADIDISVMVKVLEGKLDQGGGPMWRVADEKNYYLARWNPLEKNIRFYVVENGIRSQLAEHETQIDKSQWHSIRVVQEGTHMELFFDDEPVLAIDDETHTKAGTVGLWTKADSTALFDDLSIGPP